MGDVSNLVNDKKIVGMLGKSGVKKRPTETDKINKAGVKIPGEVASTGGLT